MRSRIPSPDAKLRESFVGNSMRELVRNTVDLSLALAGNLLAIVLDTSLLSIFIAHVQRGYSDRRIRDRDSNRSKQSQLGFSVPQYRMDVTEESVPSRESKCGNGEKIHCAMASR